MLPLDTYAYLNVSMFSVHVGNKVHVQGSNICTMQVVKCHFALLISDIRNILSDISICEDNKILIGMYFLSLISKKLFDFV